MREIKFRGKDCNGKWVYGDLRQQPCDEYCPVGIYQNDPEDWRGLPPVDPDTVGQFTGLCDMTGEAIYEGDIVEYDDTPYAPYGNKHMGDVVYYQGSWRVRYYNKLIDTICYPPLYMDDFANKKTLIIGNRYDNPDLTDYDKD